MEFHEKLQELRKQKGLTQEELAGQLYVSRTAISKWESGRGYPNIESLKAIAKYFSVTLDQLLSTDEVLIIAEENQKRSEKHIRCITFGLLDICMLLLLLLPLFATKNDGIIKEASLLVLGGVSLYLKISYFIFVIGTGIWGILTLAMQSCEASAWLKCNTAASMILGACSALLFIISSQPYAAVFAFTLLAIKAIVLIRSK